MMTFKLILNGKGKGAPCLETADKGLFLQELKERSEKTPDHSSTITIFDTGAKKEVARIHAPLEHLLDYVKYSIKI